MKMDKAMINSGYVALCLLGVIATVCDAVKITNLKVPSVYILDNQENPEALVLDCEYEFSSNEKGFVLKWLLNDHRIYQWIPSNHQPHSLSFMKNHINVNYTASSEVLHKYRALAITNPSPNMTGTYSCNVGTYESEDRQSAYLQIIVPESDLQIEINEDEDENLRVQCSAKDIFPEPKLTIVMGKDEISQEFLVKSNRDDKNNLYDVSIFGKLNKDDVKDPAEIDCLLEIPGTNYTKIKKGSQYLNTSQNLSTYSALLLTALTVAISVIFENFI